MPFGWPAVTFPASKSNYCTEKFNVFVHIRTIANKESLKNA